MTRKEEKIKASKEYGIENPIFLDGVGYDEIRPAVDFSKGVEWADRTLTDKACKWLEEHLSDEDEMHIFRDKEDTWVYCDLSVLINDFKKAMEE